MLKEANELIPMVTHDVVKVPKIEAGEKIPNIKKWCKEYSPPMVQVPLLGILQLYSYLLCNDIHTTQLPPSTTGSSQPLLKKITLSLYWTSHHFMQHQQLPASTCSGPTTTTLAPHLKLRTRSSSPSSSTLTHHASSSGSRS